MSARRGRKRKSGNTAKRRGGQPMATLPRAAKQPSPKPASAPLGSPEAGAILAKLMAPQPSFPAGLVPQKTLGVPITSVSMPVVRKPAPRKAPPQKLSAQPADPAPSAHQPAIPLPQHPDPLVTAAPSAPTTAAPAPAKATPTPTPAPAMAPQAQAYFTPPRGALPRHRSLAKPPVGLVAAIGAWLGSMGRMMAAGFMVPKARKRPEATPIPPRPQPAAAQPSLAPEQRELAQLRAENQRLRAQLEAAQARQRTKMPIG